MFRQKSFVRLVVEPLAIAIALAAGVRTAMSIYAIPSSSMLPSLEAGDHIIVTPYRLSAPERDDVIVFKYPEEPERDYIKRVIGLPGETVEVRDGRVYINGHELQEPYVPAAFWDHESFPSITLASNQYYVLGDHRDSSNDSREWGAIGRSDIYGKAVFIYWPFGQFGFLR